LPPSSGSKNGYWRLILSYGRANENWTAVFHFPPLSYIIRNQKYDCITKLCRRQAEIIQNHPNPNVRAIGQGEAIHRKYKRLKLGGGQAYHRSSD
jgi:hypothetical protein